MLNNVSVFIGQDHSVDQAERFCLKNRKGKIPVRSKLILINNNLFAYFSYVRLDYQNKQVVNLVSDDIGRLSYSLCELSNSFVSEENIERLRKLSKSDSILISTLASEILSIHSEPTVPPCINNLISDDSESISEWKMKTKESTEVGYISSKLFEDRINVDSYNFFEYVHPAYARQMVEMFRCIETYASTVESIVDVGSGTGSSLLLLTQLLKNKEITAIEPSPTAFSYLNCLGSQFKNIHFKPKKIGFLEYDLEEKTDLIISTGASHHFDTMEFMIHSSKLLNEGGVLIIADEFISPYRSIFERKKNLILHHISYMLSILFPIKNDTLNQGELKLISLVDVYIPVAYYLAKLGKVDDSEKILKSLLCDIRECKLHDYRISQPEVAFYRLILLELEALVAGLDYEVEQKTFVKNIVKMGRYANLSLISHKRVHATHGDDDDHAGTHVLAFCRG